MADLKKEDVVRWLVCTLTAPEMRDKLAKAPRVEGFPDALFSDLPCVEREMTAVVVDFVEDIFTAGGVPFTDELRQRVKTNARRLTFDAAHAAFPLSNYGATICPSTAILCAVLNAQPDEENP